MWEAATRSLHTLPWYFGLFGANETTVKMVNPTLAPHGFELLDVVALDYAVQRDEKVIEDAAEALKFSYTARDQPPPDVAFQTDGTAPRPEYDTTSPGTRTRENGDRRNDTPSDGTGASNVAIYGSGEDAPATKSQFDLGASLRNTPAEEQSPHDVGSSHYKLDQPQPPASPPLSPYSPYRKAPSVRCVHSDQAGSTPSGGSEDTVNEDQVGLKAAERPPRDNGILGRNTPAESPRCCDSDSNSSTSQLDEDLPNKKGKRHQMRYDSNASNTRSESISSTSSGDSLVSRTTCIPLRRPLDDEGWREISVPKVRARSRPTGWMA